MRRCAHKLNLAPHVVGTGAGRRWLCCCADVEVHIGRDKRYYILDTARVFPPEAPRRTLFAFLLPADGEEVSVFDIARNRIDSEVRLSPPNTACCHTLTPSLRHATQQVSRLLGTGYTRMQLPSASLLYQESAADSQSVNVLATSLSQTKVVHGPALVICGERGEHLYACLRPEFVRSVGTPLSSDAFT